MRRRGFVLLALLWTITGVAAVLVAATAVEKAGGRATRNRLLLARARWAAEACVQVARGR